MLAGRGRGGTKIRAPRRALDKDSIDIEQTWQNLSSAFREIHTKNASILSYEQLYRMAYKVVLSKKGDFLYDHVKGFEADWLAQKVRPKIQESVTAGLLSAFGAQIEGANTTERRVAGERLLKVLRSEYTDHKICNAMLSDVLMYMDRVYCTDHRKPSIYAVAMDLFRDQILRSETGSKDTSLLRIIDILNSAILDQIQMDRNGDAVEKSTLKACTMMLDAMYMDQTDAEEQKLYNLSFEPLFLDTSRQFYQKEADRLLQEYDAGSYCRHTLQRISEEKARCQTSLLESTTEKIEGVVEDELIRRKLHDLIEMESGVTYMIDNDRTEELGWVYQLNARTDKDKKAELTQALQKRVVEMGRDVNKAVALVAAQTIAPVATANEDGGDKPKAKIAPVNQMTVAAIKWVEDVLQLKDKFDRIWEHSFACDTVLQTALTRSFSDFINSSTFSRGPEYISLFIDDNMRKGIKNKSDAEVEEVLEKAIVLLRYIQDKDLFERYYKKHLSRRLLMNKSISIDAEKSMISRMKIELGNTFTAKLEAMFKDMTISDELTKNYKSHVSKLDNATPGRVELGIQVLTSGTWPLESMSSTNEDPVNRRVVFPETVDRLRQGFEKFYSNKHSGRKLTWQPQMGSADLKARLWKSDGKGGKVLRTFEYNVSTYAMLILLLFNDLGEGETISFEEIQARTNIPQNDLVRNLQSLAVAAYPRILIKEPMSRDVNSTDKFSFNEKFQPRSQKVKVGVVLAQNKVETDRERLETEKKNDDSRQYLIEAAVVRIMKQRKTLEHTVLITETIGQLVHQFKPDVAMIKHRIESLIEREYLERIEDASPAAYKYMA